MMSIEVSAVIPAYNAADFIQDAIGSVDSQTVSVKEIIVVDDGSTDNTEEVVHGRYPAVRYLKQANKGPAAARNRGVALAKSTWIAFLDADDKWVPEKLAEQIETLKQYPSVALVASDMAQTDRDFQITEPSVQARHGLKNFFTKLAGRPVDAALARLMKINFIPTGTVLARRDVILEAGGFPEDIRYGEDLALWAKVAARHPTSCLPQVHMLRRQHGDNATQSTEPLLRDLVSVSENVRQWGSATLAEQGSDADALVARAWADLGYCQFNEKRPVEALEAFRKSLAAKFNRRALFYNALCRLPAPLVYGLRGMKQRTW